MAGGEFNRHMVHPSEVIKVNLGDLTPYLDNYVMNTRDPFVKEFAWSMDDSRHTESVSKELTETNILRLMLFADKDVIQALRASSSSGATEVAGRDRLQLGQLGKADDPTPSRTEDVAPHREPDIAHHDAC